MKTGCKSRMLILGLSLSACLVGILLCLRLINPSSAHQSLSRGILTRSYSDTSRNVAEEADTAFRQKRLSLQLISETWERVASEHYIPVQSTTQVSSLLKDVLGYAQVAPTSDGLHRYEQSLRAFLQNYAFALRAEKTSSGTAYWLAFCTVEAFLRDTPTAAQRQSIQNQYGHVVEQVIKVIHRRIQSDLPPEEYGKMRNLVAEGLAHLRNETKRRIRLYNEDFLCPAFKKELDEQACAELLATYRDSNDFPRFDDPHVPMLRTKLEAWQSEYKYYIENNAGMFLCDMFFESLDFRLNKNRYWGYMSYTAESMNDHVLARPSCWPAFVQFVPDPDYNQAHRWKRKVKQ